MTLRHMLLLHSKIAQNKYKSVLEKPQACMLLGVCAVQLDLLGPLTSAILVDLLW